MEAQDSRLTEQKDLMKRQGDLLEQQLSVMQRQFVIIDRQDKISQRFASMRPNLRLEIEAHERPSSDSGAEKKINYDLSFTIYNGGDKPSKNYSIYIFVPSELLYLHSYAFARGGDLVIDQTKYQYFTLFVRDSILPKQRVRSGVLSFQGPPQQLTVQWKIEAEEGIFPSNGHYGSITVPVENP